MLALLLAVTIPLVVGECRLDAAVVTAIPPNTVHVVAISDCGGLRCWERWIETDGKRIGAARACSESGGSGETFAPVPPSR